MSGGCDRQPDSERDLRTDLRSTRLAHAEAERLLDEARSERDAAAKGLHEALNNCGELATSLGAARRDLQAARDTLSKVSAAVDAVRLAWEGEAAENVIAALDAVDRALRGVPAPASEARQCEACTAANGTATFHAPEEPCDPRPDLGTEERLQRLEAVAREFGAHVTAQRGRIEALEKRTGFEPGTIAGSVERLRARLHEGDAAKRLPRVVHEALIERAIGMFVEDMAWNRLAQEQRDRIWGALRWLVDASHGVDTAAPFDADDAPIEP